jgi:DNA-binding NarL/FixJ family response regulator
VPVTGPRRVLVIDDQPMFIEALAVALDAEPDLEFVGQARTRASAGAAVRALRPDVVTIEVGLPDGWGLDLLGDLRRDHPDLLLVALSQSEDTAVVSEALRLEVSAWVSKVEPLRHLFTVIRDLGPADCVVPPALLRGAVRHLVHDGDAARPQGALADLTPREGEVLHCMVDGLGRDEIAARLHVSPHTVRTHTQNLLAKLGLHSSVEAVAVGMRHGMRPTSDRR